ncbi:MAG: hypothetical protein R6U89_03820 [Dehalococcoidia bacterium]
MDFEPKCRTTAMGIMPHTDPRAALELALSLDVPFWPQLPRLTFSEDMFAQFAKGFPGAYINEVEGRIEFDTENFLEELHHYSAGMDDMEAFRIDDDTSMTFPRFMKADLESRAAIRGQVCGPVNFGFRVTDQQRRPLIYNDDVREILFDFALRKVNSQYRELAAKNSNAFVWVDEPGLGWVFNSFAGYNELQASEDYRRFLDGFEGPRAIHLCLNVHLPYLLDLGLDILSIDVFQLDTMPKAYSEPIAEFLLGGGIMVWGIVPTESDTLDPETPQTLLERLAGYWKVIEDNSNISREQIARRSLIAPSKCCIKNAVNVEMKERVRETAIDCPNHYMEEELVERAFSYLPEISGMLRDRFRLH